MSGCCGRKPDPSTRSTRAPAGTPTAPSAPAPAAATSPAAPPSARTRFRYTGPSALHVIGPRTGVRYRFEHHGDEIDVDPRDAAFFAALPRLVRV